MTIFTAHDIARQATLTEMVMPDIAQPLVNTPGDVGGGVYPENWAPIGEPLFCRVTPVDRMPVEREIALQLRAPVDWLVVLPREHTVSREYRLLLTIHVKHETRSFVVNIVEERYNSNPSQTTLVCKGPVLD